MGIRTKENIFLSSLNGIGAGVESASHNLQSQTPLRSGAIVADRYEIIEIIGSGGMSTVYRARETLLDRLLALKVLNDCLGDPMRLERFRNEARAYSLLEHSNIVNIYSFGVDKNNIAYIAMELLPGKSLEQILQEEGPLSRERFQEIFFPVLDALVYAHSKGIIHRDLKPGNIMIDADSNAVLQVKVVDFGLSKILGNDAQALTLTAAGPKGSPAYMSPEQCSQGNVDQRSDIYSLACVMYEAVMGKPPFVADSWLEVMHAHINKQAPEITDVSGSLRIPAALAAVLMKALCKNVRERPESMAVFQSQIVAALSSKSANLKRSNSVRNLKIACSLAFIAGCVWIYHLQQGEKRGDPLISGSAHLTAVPLSSLAQLAQARRFRKAGNYDEVVRILEPAIQDLAAKHDPGKAEQLFDMFCELGDTYGELGRWQDSIATFEKMLLQFPDPDGKYHLMAVQKKCNVLYSTGHSSEAQAFIRATIASVHHPDSDQLAQLHCLLAFILEQEKEYAEALKSAQEAQGLFKNELDYNQVRLAFLIYRMQVALGKTSPAEGMSMLRNLREVLLREPVNQILISQYAQEAEFVGLDDEARSMYLSCLADLDKRSGNDAVAARKECEQGLARLAKKAKFLH